MIISPEASSALTVTVFPVDAVPEVSLPGTFTISEAIVPRKTRLMVAVAPTEMVSGIETVESTLPVLTPDTTVPLYVVTTNVSNPTGRGDGEGAACDIADGGAAARGWGYIGNDRRSI